MCETCEALAAALETGAIGTSEVHAWRRAFEIDADAAGEILEGRDPNPRRRLENQLAAHALPFDEKLERAYVADASQRLGVPVEAVA